MSLQRSRPRLGQALLPRHDAFVCADYASTFPGSKQLSPRIHRDRLQRHGRPVRHALRTPAPAVTPAHHLQHPNTTSDVQRDYPAATRPLRRSAGNPTSTRSTPGYVGASPPCAVIAAASLFPTASVLHPRSREPSQRCLIPYRSKLPPAHRSMLPPAGHLVPTGTITRSCGTRRACSLEPMLPRSLRLSPAQSRSRIAR
ncbi:hypothetical protein B0H19DRAFT_1253980 [Mycena capillaripes]|nr:hypothetical protein B0H19DRAFT_1253980 [Mycena capillaripes]